MKWILTKWQNDMVDLGMEAAPGHTAGSEKSPPLTVHSFKWQNVFEYIYTYIYITHFWIKITQKVVQINPDVIIQLSKKENLATLQLNLSQISSCTIKIY